MKMPKNVDLSKSINREKVIEPSIANNEKNIGCPPLLNNNNTLDAAEYLNSYIRDDDNISQFFETIIKSEYYDNEALINSCSNTNRPLILSINIQSLMSKYNELNEYITSLIQNNIQIDVIILQETWNIQCPDLVNIDGFQQIVFETRTDTRGGGVGMYIRNGLEYQIRKDLQLNTMKTFENITIEVKYSKKAIIFSNIYRSPTTPPGVTQGEYLDDFLCKLDEHLNRVTDTNRDAYVFLDSNIDLLKSQHLVSSEYLDTIICNGFLQIISKATRIQGNSISLIDHILVNNNLQNYNAGTIVTDISDHMMIDELYRNKRKNSSTKQ
jgi:hypothetical protein